MINLKNTKHAILITKTKSPFLLSFEIIKTLFSRTHKNL